MKKDSRFLPVQLSPYAIESSSVRGCVIPPLSLFGTPLGRTSIAIPFNFDAEFVDNLQGDDPLAADVLTERRGVTVQIRGVAEPQGTIFAHPDHADFAERTGRTLRHPVVSSPCVVEDWLKSRGVDCEIVSDPDRYASLKKSCCLQMLAHFALADVMYLAGNGEFANVIAGLYGSRKLQMNRRLIAKASGHENARTGTTGLAPFVIRIGDCWFRLTLSIVDTIGLHGNASYADLASNVGITLDAKATISRDGENADISRMDEIYFERPDEFDSYALGDLKVSDVIYKNEELWGTIWTSLGIGHCYESPKLTIGSTVATLLRNRIATALDVELDECNPTTTHNAATLARYAKDKNPVSLLAKVDGGRCRNANPLLARCEGSYCDIDVAGAYASAMSTCPLCFGRARVVHFGNARDRAADLRQCPTLSEFLRRHEHQVVDRTWYARVSTREPLSFESDLIPSWIDYRVTTAKSDSEIAGLDVLTDPASGKMAHFGREIWSGTLTSDLLDIARNTMGKRFYEFAEKVVVRAALYFDIKDRMTVDDYRKGLKSGTLSEYAWCAMTLGELVSDIARAHRGTYAKNSPLNILFKLVSNTLYGDSVSRHFTVSSVVAGSNVTASVRAFMYLAEKGLQLVGSITDGQLFDLNGVLFPRLSTRGISPNALDTRAYRYTAHEMNVKGMAKIAPLIGKKMTVRYTDTLELVIEHKSGDVEIVRGKAAIHSRIDDAAYEHLAMVWPKCRLLNDTFKVVAGLNDDGTVRYVEQQGLFRFETKKTVAKAAIHGSANYWHIPVDPNPKENPGPKMRSFESTRRHYAFTVNDAGTLVPDPTYAGRSPAVALLGGILDDPSRVPILPPFVKTRILKPGIYQPKPVAGRAGTSRYQAPGVVVVPGDSVYVLGRPRLFSLAQFTFQTRAQYEGWKRALSTLVNRDGIGFERWYVNDDGATVDYPAMLRAIDDAIAAGVVNPRAYLSQERGQPAIGDRVRRYHDASKAMAEHVKARLGGDDDEYEIVSGGFEGAEWT